VLRLRSGHVWALAARQWSSCKSGMNLQLIVVLYVFGLFGYFTLKLICFVLGLDICSNEIWLLVMNVFNFVYSSVFEHFHVYDSYLLWIESLVKKTSNFFLALEQDLVSCDCMCFINVIRRFPFPSYLDSKFLPNITNSAIAWMYAVGCI